MLTFAMNLSYGVMFAVSLLLLWRGIVRLRLGYPLVQPRQRVSSPFGLLDVTIMFFVWLGGQLITTMLAINLLGIDPGEVGSLTPRTQAISTMLNSIGQLLATAIGLTIIWSRYRRIDIFGIQPQNLGTDFVLGVKAFFAVIPGVLLIQWLLAQLVKYEHGTLDMLSKDNSMLTIASAWFAAVLVAPLLEEVFFRGILQSWLQRAIYGLHTSMDRLIGGGWESSEADLLKSEKATQGFGAGLPSEKNSTEPIVLQSWMPVLATAAVFALAHFGQGLAWVPLFVLGIALGYLYRQTGSIFPCVVLHFGLNAFSMFWFTLRVLTS